MTIASTAVSALPRETRARVAVQATGWAYLAALWRNDHVRANQALLAFQTVYNQHSAAVMLGFLRADDARRFFPVFVPVTGSYNAQTRLALVAAIGSIGTQFSATLQDAPPPTAASALGAWFWSKLVPLHDIADAAASQSVLWQFDRLARAEPEAEVAAALLARAFGLTEGLQEGSTGAPAAAQEDLNRAVDQARDNVRLVPGSTRDPATGIVHMPDELALGERGRRSGKVFFWFGLAGAVGMAALGLGLAWPTMKRWFK